MRWDSFFMDLRKDNLTLTFCAVHTAHRLNFFHGIYPNRQLAAFDGYQGSHLKTIGGFDGEIDWDFLAQDLQEPRT